jgi:hypothetical protein
MVTTPLDIIIIIIIIIITKIPATHESDEELRATRLLDLSTVR